MKLDLESHYLWIPFQLNEQDYCVSSRYVDFVGIPKEIFPIPRMQPYMLGFTKQHGRMIPVIDLRVLFSLPSLRESVEQFSQMKTMHIRWLETLQESVTNRRFFTLPVDPHACEFGRWYDHFVTENSNLRLLLDKIENPHSRIHHCGAQINEQMALNQPEAIAETLSEAQRIFQKEMLPLLDRLIEAYREVNRGTLLVLRFEERKLGVLVDKVTGLWEESEVQAQPVPNEYCANSYLEKIILHGTKAFFAIGVPEILKVQQSENSRFAG